jgi:hypothetical protein
MVPVAGIFVKIDRTRGRIRRSCGAENGGRPQAECPCSGEGIRDVAFIHLEEPSLSSR